ncbi:DUF2953 domain-containing protein [Paramaledivibacter caminithermalis]|uniref:DUF2953 domain-containing protein n=1 Tax=Paramaledivibacter caminithermalis (strain DSM 15212 / CIP 107654 / DViRD3) TaxID=1121301 RepID=A0A1M6JNI8_PARC5|nr:DUF2953 domain-containing protein [Paramaledivibacter caminithermalis]SHJ48315.1 Protein of unknown function [Paramaledivibacter caminithermalis DSM 15212]
MLVGIIIIILMTLILISSVKVNIIALKENDDNKAVIKISFLYGLIRFKKELDFMGITKKNKEYDEGVDTDLELKMKNDSWTEHKGYTDYVNIRKMIEKTIEILKTYKNIIRYLIDRINFRTLLWKTEVGFEDAALTGITSGIINIFKSNLFTMLNSSKKKPEKIHLKILPNFNKHVLKTDLNCIFTMRIGYIIIVGLKYLWIKGNNKYR